MPPPSCSYFTVHLNGFIQLTCSSDLTRGPRPTTHRRTGHAEASPTGAQGGLPDPRDGGVPPRERESEGAAATAPCGPLRPPDPGDGEATPPGSLNLRAGTR